MTAPRNLALKLAVIGFLLHCGVGGAENAAAAEPQKITITIQAQPLRKALNEWASQTGYQVLLSSREEAGSRMSPALTGSYTPEAALQQLLINSGLRYEFVAARTVTILSSKAPVEEGKKISAQQILRLVEGGSGDVMSKDEANSADDKSSKGKKSDVEEMIVEDTKIKPYSDANIDIPRTINDPQAYYIFDSKTIERSGAMNIEDFLKQRLTMDASIQSNSQRPAEQFVGETAGTTTSSFNLRGLGTDRTLILVNGRRMAGVSIMPISSAPWNEQTTTQPDVNGIPLAAIERIEVLPTSASGIYGGSAMGGVINIVLKDRYSGGSIGMSYDNMFDVDRPVRTVDGSYGFSLEDGKTNVNLSASYTDSKPMMFKDRVDLTLRGISILKQRNPFYQNQFPMGKTIVRTSNGSNLILKAADGGINLGTSFSYLSDGMSQDKLRQEIVADLVQNAGKPVTELNPGANSGGLLSQFGMNASTYSVMVNANRRMSDSVNAFLSTSFNKNTGHGMQSPLSSFFLNRIRVSNPFEQSVVIMFPSMLQVPADVHSENRSVSAGVNLRLPMEWSGEFDYTWSQNKFDHIWYDTNTSELTNGFNSGTLNPFVDMLNYPYDFASTLSSVVDTSSNTQRSLALRLSGPVAHLPWGSPNLTLGFEHRKSGYPGILKLKLPPPSLAAKYPPNFYPSETWASYGKSQSTSSIYAEMSIPLVTDKNALPLMRSLDVQIADRVERFVADTGTDFSMFRSHAPDQVYYFPAPADANSEGINGTPIFGTSTSYGNNSSTIALKYSPVGSVTVRASLSQAFLPPSYQQLTPNPKNYTAGVYVQDPLNPNYDYSGSVINYTSGGNPELLPERSKSWNIGVIFEPKSGMLAGMRANVESYKIKRRNRIIGLSSDEIVRNPNVFGDRITRDANNLITAIDNRLFNSNKDDMAGLDVALAYSKPTSFGTFDISAATSVLDYDQRQYTATSPLLDYVGFPSEGGSAQGKANATLVWSQKQWSLGWTTTWFSSYRQNGSEGSPYALQYGVRQDYVVLQAGNSIPSQMYHQFFASYAFPDRAAKGMFGETLSNLTVQLSVKNVFNTLPPFDAYFYPYYYSTYGDIRLRDYRLMLRKNF